ncbi:MAG: ATP-grasp domain-containing protein [Acidobacteriota bacterium]
MSARGLRVGVTGIHLGENAQPGPGVIRSLREALGDEVVIIGLAYDALDSSLYVPGLLDDAFLLPYPSAGPRAYFDRLVAIQDACGLDVLVPNLDVELPVLLRLERPLHERGIRMALPSAAALARRTKERLPELARAVSVATPQTLVVADERTLAMAGEALAYPMLVKGPFYEADVVHGPAEAAASFRRLAGRWGLPLLAQRHVHGEELDVIALGDGAGRVHGPVAMRKTVVTKLGKAWGAVTIEDASLIEAATRIVSALAWRGGCEIEMMRESGTGTLYLIEVNPRFPAWVYLATAAGVNLPVGTICLALDRELPSYDPYRPGVSYVRHASEAIGDPADIEALLTEGRTRRRAPVPERTVDPSPVAR